MTVVSEQGSGGRGGEGDGPPSEGGGRDALGFARRLLDALHDAAYYIDREGRAHIWNEAATRQTGYSREEIFAAPVAAELLGYADWAGALLRGYDLPSWRSMRDGRAVEQRMFVRHRDGRRVWIEARGSPVRDESGTVVGALVVLRDATSSIVAEEELRQARRAAESDPLTGLANRRSLDRMLDLLQRIQAAEGRPFSLVIADLDHFKSINDGWGHEVGDRALIAFAETLQRQCRAEDLVARLGGEEFVVLLPDHTLEVAARIAQRLRHATPEATPDGLGGRRLTASFGVAQSDPDESAADLVRRADAALYRAKAAGRDRVEVDGPTP